jgi:hypothetical protein
MFHLNNSCFPTIHNNPLIDLQEPPDSYKQILCHQHMENKNNCHAQSAIQSIIKRSCPKDVGKRNRGRSESGIRIEARLGLNEKKRKKRVCRKVHTLQHSDRYAIQVPVLCFYSCRFTKRNVDAVLSICFSPLSVYQRLTDSIHVTL